MAPTSRIDFTPAHTTSTPVRDSVVRSADSSKVSCAPRWTPPRPPVAKTVMPAAAARCAVEATVVEPTPPRAAIAASSRTLTLVASSSLASRSRAASSSPIRACPSITATVAGTAPPSRTACSNSRARRALSGRGRPWLMIVLSSATTAWPAARASRTSSCTSTGSSGVGVSCSRAGRTRVAPARGPHPAGRRGSASRRHSAAAASLAARSLPSPLTTVPLRPRVVTTPECSSSR